ncbi:MAG: ABC transporter ATP-binding protein [Geobacteraceae bacterium]|nr:ABC transporter ATP-binding protein [Geobacteraceae bacterium]
MKQQTTDPILEVQAVRFRYPDGSVGLDGCSLAIQRGSRTALLGANGAGKSTLFLHLNGILRPMSGAVLFEGLPVDYGRQGLHHLRSRVGLVFQNPDRQLFSARVREDISFGPLNLGLDAGTVRNRVEEALLAVGMTACADKPVHNLSFGQKKRVCIAGVLAMQAELAQILDRLHAEGMTVIIATHDMDYAYQWADVLAIMDTGICAASWDAAQLPAYLDQLEGFGVGVPRVAEMHKALAACGLFGPDLPAVRSHSELLDAIAKMAAVGSRP